MLVPVVAIVLLSGCTKRANEGGSLKGKVTLSGSTAMLPLAQQAKEAFEGKYPDVTVNVSGGGSFTGLNQVASGSVDIGNSDVSVEGLAEFKDKDLVDHRVAVAPFVLVVNPGVKVDNLTKAQAEGIFTGEITNWKNVGGEDQPISVIHRPPSSGSRAVIKELVLGGKEFTNNAATQDSNGSLRAALASTPGSIGYVDVAYLDSSIKAVSFNGVPYKPENVYNKTYPIFAYEHMYTKGQPT
ncbi:MAG: phosphate ABC transporter substrate-binding protein, partial [Firmicutes bacterium]|nr:phosphate ABC transporter substrate-binding protein [Bacillota bacterium]